MRHQGTVHVFNLPPDSKDANFAPEELKAQRSCLGFMAGLGLLPTPVEDYVPFCPSPFVPRCQKC